MKLSPSDQSEFYIQKMKSQMTEAIRRENLVKAPAINRSFTNQYQVAGMYADNSMRAY